MAAKKSFLSLSVLFFLAFLPKMLQATSNPEEDEFQGWYTGPLLAPAGHTMTPGVINWEPYIFATDDFGFYDNSRRAHSTPDTITINPLLSLTMGLNSFMDLQFAFQTVYNHKSGRGAFRVADTTAYLGFQILEDKRGSLMPDLRFTLNMTFPTGQYEKLDPEKNGTDSSGLGTYAPGASLNFQKLIHIYRNHHLRTRLSFTYTYHIPVHVKGFNSYGGGFMTKGKVYPGNVFVGYFSFEYNFTKNWVFAMDTQYLYANKTRFSGRPGFNLDGTIASVGKGSSEQWSLAPALEYNFSAFLGIIGGVWFSVSGRNAEEFISGAIAVNYAY
ncbi:MAG: hypothetical protein Tsb0015_01520 [Simkaniaceae bacterium]